jgi:alkylhydroperoxidase family enzyme
LRSNTDYRTAGAVSEAEVAMMVFAEKVSTSASAMTDEDSLVLRGHGFSDREIVDIVLAAAVRSYFSKALQALAVEADGSDGVPPAVASALVQGL